MSLSSHQIRIIGGTFKGKKLDVLDLEGLRPTPGRIRETIFNLLNDKVQEANVLDLFAGSGALGIEALSRGATSVTLVEKDFDNYLNLKDTVKTLNSKNIQVLNLDALNFLNKTDAKFDLIFLDPPYKSDLLTKAMDLINERNLLNKDAVLYVEYGSGNIKSFVGFECFSEQQSGQVKFAFYKKSSFLEDLFG